MKLVQPELSDRRSRLYVDREVQSSLVRRILLHWLAFVAVAFGVVGVLQACVEHPTGSPADWAQYALARNFLPLLAGLALVPVFVYDTIRATNRFAGPVQRLRRLLRAIADGEDIRHFEMRKDDQWSELADEINRAFERLRQDAEARQKLASAATQDERRVSV